MLRLLRDEIGIFIGPGKIALVRTRRGFRPRCIQQHVVSFEAAAANDWAPAIGALRERLAEGAWTHANVRVVVSDHWAHYEILPWAAQLSSEPERLAHARHLMASVFGDIVDQWTLSLSAATLGKPRLISAIPTDLIEELRMAAAGDGRRVVSLQPQLIVAYNSWRHRLPRSAAWFATIDEGSLAALHLSNGRCDWIRAVRISDDWVVELCRIQTMGRLAQSRSAGPVYVDAPSHVRALAATAAPAVEWLSGRRTDRGTLAFLCGTRELQT